MRETAKSDAFAQDRQEEWIVGRNAVAEALRAGRAIDRLLVAKGDRNGRILPLVAQCRERGIPIKETDVRRLDELCGTNHQGIAAVAACKAYATVEDILALAAERGEPPFVILCDELEEEISMRRAEVRVATSDLIEQTIAFGRGAGRISSRELLLEMDMATASRGGNMGSTGRRKTTVADRLPEEIRARLERMRRGEE